MRYSETIEYLYKRLPMYQRVGKAAYKADLKNTETLMELLNHPHKALKSIHVGGTNGKGSVSHMLASILQEEGYKVGLYTSPHLVDFRERIRINGKKIPREIVVEFVENHKTEFENIDLSFFEWTVGLCFDYFKREEVDLAVIEVGMGGRLDSTNVITPLVSIITNIGLDHVQFLGNSSAKIAREKAGIIKQGVPVVIGAARGEVRQIFEEKARAMNAPISFANEVHQERKYEMDLGGNYQITNQKTVLAAIPYLKKQGIGIHSKSIEKGFKSVVSNTGLLGRWQVIQQNPKVICDTAHNEDGLISVLQQLKNERFKNIHFVLGMVNDKNYMDLLKLFPQSGKYYFCQASVPRSLPAEELKLTAQKVGLIGNAFNSVSSAYQSALSMASTQDLIYVGGSTFVVADLLTYLDVK